MVAALWCVGGFRDLAVYRRAVGLADALHASVGGWPGFDRFTVGTQLVRAADSVGANIAEAYGRWGPKDQRRALHIARGSAYEMAHWVERAEARHLALPDSALEEAHEISRMLNGLIASHRAPRN